MPEKKLVEIVWNDEKEGFVIKENNRKVKSVLPIGPLSSSSETYGCSPKTTIEEFAKKYVTKGTIGYEAVKTASDVNGGEFSMGPDAYAFRLYKIS